MTLHTFDRTIVTLPPDTETTDPLEESKPGFQILWGFHGKACKWVSLLQIEDDADVKPILQAISNNSRIPPKHRTLILYREFSAFRVLPAEKTITLRWMRD